jgi:purine-nucleoside phosphorylase
MARCDRTLVTEYWNAGASNGESHWGALAIGETSVNLQIAHLVTSANFLKDVNANGILTVSDKVITNNNVTKALPAP